MSLNKVMLIGNVGKDPDIRYLEGSQNSAGNAVKVASFVLATSERYRDRNGELRENTEWHNIVAWRALADLVEKYVKKGTSLYIEGRIRTRSWNDREEKPHYVTEILADGIQLLGRRSDNPATSPKPAGEPNAINPPTLPGNSHPATAATAQSTVTAPGNSDQNIPDDDLPF